MIDIKASRAGSRDEEIMVRSSRNNHAVALSVAAAVVVLATSSRPYPINQPWLGAPGAGPTLTQDDVTRMQAAVARLNEGRPIGTVERWRGATSGNSGEVVLARRFDAKGMSCHALHYLVRFKNRPNGSRAFAFNWCRQPDGAWKIVELGS